MKFLKIVCFFLIPFSVSAQNYYGVSPALFEDFSYTNTRFPIAGDSSNSLYGKNIWLTEKGKISSRAWHRNGWMDGINVGQNSSIEPTRNGISLSVFKGFRVGDMTPIIYSGFIFKEGTYVSRVRCSALQPNTFTIQAYWLYTPASYRFKTGNDSITYINEVDFEWNNWFAGRGEKRMHASTVGARYNNKPSAGINVEMNFFQKAESGQMVDIGKKVDDTPEYYFENRWYYYLIRLTEGKHTAEFLMESAEEDNIAMQKVVAGSGKTEPDTIAPVLITESYPARPLMTVYNIGLVKHEGNDSLLKIDMKLDVDWFYYTPRVDAGISDIAQEVKNLRSQNITRLNTTGAPLHYDITKPLSVSITGPETIRVGGTETWRIEPSVRINNLDIEFSYRFITAGKSGEWVEISKEEIPLTVDDTVRQIEFRSKVTQTGTTETASTTKIVKVLP